MSNLDLAKIATHFSCKQEWDNFFLLSLQIIEHPSPPPLSFDGYTLFIKGKGAQFLFPVFVKH